MKKEIVKLTIECVLIIMSVLLAFWIDKKSKQSENNELKEELISRIYLDLQNDSANFSRFIRNRDLVNQKLETLIAYSNTDKMNIDSLSNLLKQAEWLFSYNSNNSTYYSIVSSGQLELFKSDTLFMTINTYYNSNEKRIMELTGAYANGVTETLIPYLNLHFDRRLFFAEYKKTARTVDLDKFTNREFSNILFDLRDRLILGNELQFHHKRQMDLLNQIRKANS
jgi:hypothetical protein